MEAQFVAKLKEDRLTQKDNSFCFSFSKYQETIDKVKHAKLKPFKESSDYRLIKRFDVIEVAGSEKLIAPPKENSEIIYFVCDEELFEILRDVHVSIGHGGRDRMMKQLRRKYKNITYKDVNIFLSVCEPCLQKPKREKKGTAPTIPTAKPLLTEDLNSSRCQVDLIDYQFYPDGDFNFILVYQDHLTKFLVLKALRSQESDEVADNLMDIFTLLGAPTLIQSNNGRDFVDDVIENLKLIWPDLRLVRGKPRESQKQSTNQHIENMITTWMQDNQTSRWSKGLRFLQLMKNKACHSGIKKSPYEALFGHPLQLGLATSSIPQENLVDIQEEEELESIIRSVTAGGETESPGENEVVLFKEEIMEDQGLGSNDYGSNNDNLIDEYLKSPEENEPAYGIQLKEEPIEGQGLVFSLLSNEDHFIVGDLKCVVCQGDCTLNNSKCKICEHYFHLECGFKKDSETYYVCAKCGREKEITKEGSLSSHVLEHKAKILKKSSNSGPNMF